MTYFSLAMTDICHTTRNDGLYGGKIMLFGLLAIVLIIVSAVIFSVLGVAVDNLGDKCIEAIDAKRAK